MLRVVAVLGLFWHASALSPSLQDGAVVSSLSVRWQHPNGSLTAFTAPATFAADRTPSERCHTVRTVECAQLSVRHSVEGVGIVTLGQISVLKFDKSEIIDQFWFTNSTQAPVSQIRSSLSLGNE